jgi:hypothetical protein
LFRARQRVLKAFAGVTKRKEPATAGQ